MNPSNASPCAHHAVVAIPPWLPGQKKSKEPNIVKVDPARVYESGDPRRQNDGKVYAIVADVVHGGGFRVRPIEPIDPNDCDKKGALYVFPASQFGFHDHDRSNIVYGVRVVPLIIRKNKVEYVYDRGTPDDKQVKLLRHTIENIFKSSESLPGGQLGSIPFGLCRD